MFCCFNPSCVVTYIINLLGENNMTCYVETRVWAFFLIHGEILIFHIFPPVSPGNHHYNHHVAFLPRRSPRPKGPNLFSAGAPTTVLRPWMRCCASDSASWDGIAMGKPFDFVKIKKWLIQMVKIWYIYGI